jgi:hypothetical protein
MDSTELRLIYSQTYKILNSFAADLKWVIAPLASYSSQMLQNSVTFVAKNMQWHNCTAGSCKRNDYVFSPDNDNNFTQL